MIKWVYIDYWMYDFFWASLTNPYKELIVLKRSPFIKNMVITKNLTEDTAYTLTLEIRK